MPTLPLPTPAKVTSSGTSAFFNFGVTHIKASQAAILERSHWKNLLVISAPENSIQQVFHVTGVDPLKEKKLAAIQELEEYLNFPANWDGYFGEQFDLSLVQKAKKIVEYIANFFKNSIVVPSEITPGPASDGSIDIEVVFQGKTLIFTLQPDLSTVQAYIEKGKNAYEETFEFTTQNLDRKLFEICC